MGALENIKAKLPEFIARSQALNHLLGPIGNAIDVYNIDAEAFRDALNVESGNPAMLDALAGDYGLVRHYNDTDRIMAIRILNAIQTHQQRGTQAGLENEGREIALATPYNQRMRFVIGVTGIGTGWALGGVGSEWIQYWIDTPENQADLEAMLLSVIPLHVRQGIDSIDANGATAGYQSIRGSELTDGVTYTITNTGFYADKDTLIPRNITATYLFGNIDLLATFANYQWLVDWVDYAAWDVDFDLLVEVRFSSDEIAWNEWTPYSRNQWVQGVQLERYAQFRITLTMNTYRNLNHYVFRSFILKGLTTAQQRYGEAEKAIAVLPYVGN